METEYLQLRNKAPFGLNSLYFDISLPIGDLLDTEESYLLVGSLLVCEISTKMPILFVTLFESFFSATEIPIVAIDSFRPFIPHIVDSLLLNLSGDFLPISILFSTPVGSIVYPL